MWDLPTIAKTILAALIGFVGFLVLFELVGLLVSVLRQLG